MGSTTRHAYRMLFTATNVRLGVWLPHPNVVRDARRWMDFEDAPARPSRDGTAAAAEAEHDSGGRGTAAAAAVVPGAVKLFARKRMQNRRREARLWAHVLRLRLAARRNRRAVVPGHAANPGAAVGRGGRAA